MTYTMQPFPTLTDDDPTDMMNAINQTARIRLQDIANQTNSNQATQNIATTGIIACTATGTNTIALQQNANQTVISGYTNYQQFSFVAAANSSGNVTINVNTIGALNLYKSDGATRAASGTLSSGALYVISYNSALNSNAGGFQIVSGSSSSGLTVGTTAIASGTNGYIEYNNNGVLGELATIGSGSSVVMSGFFAPITNTMSSDVTCTLQNTFYDGPSIAQGTTGTWYVTGYVTLATGGSAHGNVLNIKLWDGTTVFASTQTGFIATATISSVVFSLSAICASPASNIKISVEDTTAGGTTVIKHNASGLGNDSQIQAVRVA